MQHNPFVTEERLHQHADFEETRKLIPELLYKLITASILNPDELRIPLIINQPDWDIIVDSPVPFAPFVPQGKSFWEVGTSKNPRDKATKDFTKRTRETDLSIRQTTTYIVVTPRAAGLSNWDLKKQKKWKKDRESDGWKEIKIVDATILRQWLSRFPEIDIWLADKFGIPTNGYYSPSLFWKQLENYGAPPPLQPIIFMDGRKEVVDKILDIFRGVSNELRIESLFPDEGIDLVVSALKNLPENEQYAFSGRCLIIENPETWKRMCTLNDHYILVAKPNLDLDGTGAELKNFAKTYRKSLIYSTTPSAYANVNTIKLPEMAPHQLSMNLTKCGYSEERARQVAEKCRGKITTLKRILLDISVSPVWSRTEKASEIAIATLVGQWDAKETGDVEAVTGILGKKYGEWIQKILPMTVESDPPLTQQNEKWRFISRYEGWLNLGKFITDQHLNRFSEWVIKVFNERDPKFDLPKDEQWMADAKGKREIYSKNIMMGFAETLALIGTFPKALSSTSNPEVLLARTIREIFKDADWKNWASLNNYLPLLAESDPATYLEQLEIIVEAKEIILSLFSQEGSGITGWNYMTGILWSLETLAWSEVYLTRVCLILCELSLLDPGGNWANRPYNSLVSIFLPGIKQTTASIERKITAFNNIKNDFPDIYWKLLLDLLPRFGGRAISRNRKPTWRNFIPEEFIERYSSAEYKQELDLYIPMCINFAKDDFNNLVALVERIDDIPVPYFQNILEYLKSPDLINKSEDEKSKIWEILEDKIRKHRKFHDARWALPVELISKIEEVNILLIPSNPLYKYAYLFNDYDIGLYEEKENFEKQRDLIEDRRTNAIKEIYALHGINSVIEFARSIKLPIEVGAALGRNKEIDEDNFLIPKYLDQNEKQIIDFVRGYVSTKFRILEFVWVNKFDFSNWNVEQKLQFLGILPFIPQTWELAKNILESTYEKYWNNTDAAPYFLKSENLHDAVDKLILFKRPRAAIKVIQWMLHLKISPDINKVYKVLLSDIQNDEKYTPLDSHSIIELIKWLRHQANTNEDTLSKIEWIYLRWLDRYSGASPGTLHKALASRPEFFCEVLRVVYRSINEKEPAEIDEEKKTMAEQAYYLLQDFAIIPGTQTDGEINEDDLNMWLDKVKTICSQSGHFSIALSTVGKVFAHFQEYPTGLFLNKSIAKILNQREHKEMRDGYTTEKFNMRGVFYGSSGESEKALAQEYDKKADEVEKEGFSRLATSLREMARLYRLDAERESKSDPLDLL
ncbi:MAG: hypothetical protein ACYCVH_13845 [Ignavibacteriaceae bacterium]